MLITSPNHIPRISLTSVPFEELLQIERFDCRRRIVSSSTSCEPLDNCPLRNSPPLLCSPSRACHHVVRLASRSVRVQTRPVGRSGTRVSHLRARNLHPLTTRARTRQLRECCRRFGRVGSSANNLDLEPFGHRYMKGLS